MIPESPPYLLINASRLNPVHSASSLTADKDSQLALIPGETAAAFGGYPVLSRDVPGRIQGRRGYRVAQVVASPHSAQQPDRITVRVLSLFAFRYTYCMCPEVG